MVLNNFLSVTDIYSLNYKRCPYGYNWLNNANGNWCRISWETGEKMWEEYWNCMGFIIAADRLLYIYNEKRGNVGQLNATHGKFDR
jgi:hypothetical protein